MPSTSTPGSGQVPSDAQSPDGNGQVPPTSQASSTVADGGSDDSTGLSPEQLKDALTKARQDAAKNRVDAKRLAELEHLQQEAENAKLSEKERYEKQRAQDQERINALELARQEALIRADVKLAAHDLGITEKLARLILAHEEIEYDESGDPTNIAALLRAAAEEHGIASTGAAPQSAAANNGTGRNGSQQQQQHVSSGGAVNPGRSNTSNGGLFDGDPQTVMQRISHLSPNEYAARGDEIRAFLAQNWQRLRR